MKIEEHLIEEYERDGAICLRGIFSNEWITSVSRGIEENLKNPSPYSEKLRGDQKEGHYFDDYCNWRRIPEFQDYVLDSPAAAIVGQLMRSKYAAFYHEHVLVKEPGTDKETPWHHDQSYYPIDGNKVCSIWMPVDPVPKNVCVRFVAGSHKWAWYYPIKFATTLPYEMEDASKVDRVYESVPDVDANKDYKILYWDMQPGDCIVFHMRTLHGAPGNESPTKYRRVLSTRWLGEDAVIASRPWKVSPPMLGKSRPGDSAASDEFPILWRSKNA